MRPLLYGLIISSVVLTNCKPQEDSTPQFTFKGQILNATTNEVPVGLSVTLQATSSPDLFTKFKKEILGTAITDSMGRFSITYKKTSLPILTLLSQFLTYNDLPINKNVDTIFYRSTKGTLVYKLISDSPLLLNDTLYFTLPDEEGKNWYDYAISGPLSKTEIFKFRTSKTRGIQGAWGLGKVNYNDVGYHPEKHQNQLFIFNMQGDPFIDTIKIKNR